MIGSLRGKGCLLKIAFAFSGIKFHSIFPGAYQLNRFGLFPANVCKTQDVGLIAT